MFIKQVTRYQSTDGALHTTEQEATKHEAWIRLDGILTSCMVSLDDPDRTLILDCGFIDIVCDRVSEIHSTLREVYSPADTIYEAPAKKINTTKKFADAVQTVLAEGHCFLEGNQWCYLVGDNIQAGIAGFGNTPGEALDDLLGNLAK